MKKLWDKGIKIDDKIEKFTIGMDRELDLEMAEFDILGSLAHVKMLHQVGIISGEELPQIEEGLKEILVLVNSGEFIIKEHVEDVHSQVEMLLTEKIGELGGKIHTGRSRNDQVLVDLKLYYRKRLGDYIKKLTSVSALLLEVAEEYKDVYMPGYTHTQIAMTSSFGMWFTAFAEAFYEDAQLLTAIFPIINKNPLGSAAGYGSSFPLNRTMTTELLGFDDMHINPINAQYGRGKSELIMSQALAGVAMNINKLATDMISYSNENYKFLSLPSELTTGSSIMPHKKNPDVYELIRAHSNLLINLPAQISMLISNMTTGYHRDFQLLKEILFPAFHKMDELLDIIEYTIPRLEIKEGITDDEKYNYLLTVDSVNELVKKGVPFRKAYLEVGRLLEDGSYKKPEQLDHTHEGSLGNLGIAVIKKKVEAMRLNNPYSEVQVKINQLLK